MINFIFKTIFIILCLSQFNFANNKNITVIFVPGAGAKGPDLYIAANFYVGSYWGNVIKHLNDNGFLNVYASPERHEGNGSIEERANDLVKELLDINKITEEKVHLIGHSMGGLVARVAAHNPKIRDLIVSITTVATPHRGTPNSEYLLEQKEKRTFFNWLSETVGYDVSKRRYLKQVTRDSMVEFNKKYFDIPSIDYFSFTLSINKKSIIFASPFLLKSFNQINDALSKLSEPGDNDGVVPLYSQKWGEVRKHLDTDHASVIGKNIFGSKFDYKDFYLRHIEFLMDKYKKS